MIIEKPACNNLQNNTLSHRVSQPALIDQINVLQIRELLEQSGYVKIMSTLIAKAARQEDSIYFPFIRLKPSPFRRTDLFLIVIYEKKRLVGWAKGFFVPIFYSISDGHGITPLCPSYNWLGVLTASPTSVLRHQNLHSVTVKVIVGKNIPDYVEFLFILKARQQAHSCAL